MDKVKIILFLAIVFGLGMETTFSKEAFKDEFSNMLFIIGIPFLLQIGGAVAKEKGNRILSFIFHGLISIMIFLSGYNYIQKDGLKPEKPIPRIPTGKPIEPKLPKESDYTSHWTNKDGSAGSYFYDKKYKRKLRYYEKVTYPRYEKKLRQWKLDNKHIFAKRNEFIKYNKEEAGRIDWNRKMGSILLVFISSIGCPLFTLLMISSFIARIKDKPDNYKDLAEYKKKYFEIKAKLESSNIKLTESKEDSKALTIKINTLESEIKGLRTKHKRLSNSKNKYVIKYHAVLEYSSGIKEMDFDELSELSGYAKSSVRDIYNRELKELSKDNSFRIRAIK